MCARARARVRARVRACARACVRPRRNPPTANAPCCYKKTHTQLRARTHHNWKPTMQTGVAHCSPNLAARRPCPPSPVPLPLPLSALSVVLLWRPLAWPSPEGAEGEEAERPTVEAVAGPVAPPPRAIPEGSAAAGPLAPPLRVGPPVVSDFRPQQRREAQPAAATPPRHRPPRRPDDRLVGHPCRRPCPCPCLSPARWPL